MKITYIHHSSFTVELDHAVLLFDYFQGELPQFPKEKPLFVFASHFHGDHYNPIIFTLAEGRENIFYVLSGDIKGRNVPEELMDRIRFTDQGEMFFISQGDMKIETFKSTDEGVAFWISVEGKELYFAGDLNNWWWEGEEKSVNHNMAANYSREILKLEGRHADAAFVPLDPRQEAQFYLGMDEFLKIVTADTVFPMHFWMDYSIIDKMKQHPCSKDYRDKIVEIHTEGEEFVL